MITSTSYTTFAQYLKHNKEKIRLQNKGHVYILKCEYKDITLVKIGKSTNYVSRLNSHKTSNPMIEYVTHYECDMRLERVLHNKLSDKLYDGCTEWFTYYDGIFEDIDMIVKESKLEYDDYSSYETELNRLYCRGKKVWKLKSVYGNGYIYVVDYNRNSAIKYVKDNYFLNVVFDGEASTDILTNDQKLVSYEPYTIFNNIPPPKFKPEFCNRRRKKKYKPYY